MKRFIAAALAVLFATAAYGQNSGTVTNHAFALGKGAGTTGYTSLLCASAQLAVGQATADPICRTISGDATLSAAGGLTLGTVNANVGSFGDSTHTGQFTVNGKGLITAASSVALGGLPPSGAAGGDITGTYPNPTLVAIVAAGGPTGSATVAPVITYDAKGRITAVSSATITPAAASITGGAALTKTDDTNVTLTLGGSPTVALLAGVAITAGWTGTLANARLATMATNTVKGNATSGTASPTDLAVGTCSTNGSALNWTTNTGFGCNTSITAAAVPVGGVTGLGTGVATALANTLNAASGLVGFSGNVGAATATSVNGLLITATTGGLTINNGKTLGISNTMQLASTDGANVAFGVGGTVLYNGGAGGTPSSLTLTNATGLPISSGLTGAGTSVLTALGVNVGSVGAFVVNGGALGTPSSGTLTNATGLPTAALTGTLQAAQEPAHTGDVTNSAGSLALSITNNAVTLAKLATQATNTVLANVTSGTAVPTAFSVSSCDTATKALQWTTNTGFACNSSITAAAVPASGLTGATLASGVTASSLTSVGTLTGGTASTGFILGGVTVTVGSDGIGDIHYRNSSGVFTRLGIGSAGNVLTVASGLPSWAAPAAAAAGSLTGATLAAGVTASSLTSFGTSPTLITPTLGVATATSVGITGGSFASGTVYYDATNGLATALKTGSANDFIMKGPGGANIFAVPTGTTDFNMFGRLFAGLTQTSAAQSGTVCFNSATTLLTYDATVGCLASTMTTKNAWHKIEPQEALQAVLKMETGSFTYKPGMGLPGGEQIGFNAEQIATVDIRLVGYEPDDKTKLRGVRYQQTSAMYAAAIQQLKADNDNLRACQSNWKCRLFGWGMP